VSAHANSLEGVKMNEWDSELWNIADWTRAEWSPRPIPACVGMGTLSKWCARWPLWPSPFYPAARH